MSERDQIEVSLWDGSANPEEYSMDKYQDHLLEQYKLYVEMADRISQRRGIANTFFLTFNTAIVGALAAFFKDIPSDAALAMYAAALTLCIVWSLLLRSYRNLNTAKFLVIGLMEKRLPSSPYWAAEWKALGEGKNWRKYIPLSHLETYVPVIFLLIYVYLAYITLNVLPTIP